MELEKRIERILRYSGGEWSLSDFMELIRSRKILVFEYQGSLVLMEVQVYPQKRILHIWGCEGASTLNRMTDLVKWAKEVARILECTELRCQGRKGWERALSSHGAKVLYTTLVMEL